MAAQGRKQEAPLRILCFGNSLSCGYPVDNPYANRLGKVVKEFSGRKVECVVNGQPGDLVTGPGYTRRMQSSWDAVQEPYDWTIVLGGTNDLGWGRLSDQIIEGLKRAWEIPLSKGGKVLALTIPEVGGNFRGITEKREVVNKFISEYEKENFFHFDLSTKLPYHKMPRPNQVKYWDPDGVHLTADGYDLMGELIGKGLIQIMGLAEAQGTDISSVVSDERQRKAIENLIFEEEMGDPRLLSQGYIVVRKKDLD